MINIETPAHFPHFIFSILHVAKWPGFRHHQTSYKTYRTAAATADFPYRPNANVAGDNYYSISLHDDTLHLPPFGCLGCHAGAATGLSFAILKHSNNYICKIWGLHWLSLPEILPLAVLFRTPPSISFRLYSSRLVTCSLVILLAITASVFRFRLLNSDDIFTFYIQCFICNMAMISPVVVITEGIWLLSFRY